MSNMSKRTAAYNWGNDASADNKARIIADRFDGEIPDCLWYALGEDYVPDRDALRVAVAGLFEGEVRDIDMIETPRSEEPKGWILRVLGATSWKPKIVVQGREAHLFRAGHNDDKGRRFCFLTQWSLSRFRPGETVRVTVAARYFAVGIRGGGIRRHVFPRYDVVVVESRFDNVLHTSDAVREALAACPVLAMMVYRDMSQNDSLLDLKQVSFEIVVVKLPDGSSVEISADMLELAGSE